MGFSAPAWAGFRSLLGFVAPIARSVRLDDGAASSTLLTGIAALVLLFTTSSRAAAAEPISALTLSLEDALTRAAQASPEVVTGHRAIRQAEARRVGAGIIVPGNPRVAFDVRPSLNEGRTWRDAGYGAMVDWLFEPIGAPGARVREADREVDVATADLGIETMLGRLRAWSSYVRAQIAELRIAEARSSREISERVLGAAQRRVGAGAGSELEQASAELDLAQVRAAEAAAVRERDGRLMELRDALDLRAGVALVLSSPLQDPEPLPDAASYVEKTVQRHPALAALRARLLLLDATRGRLEREVSPRIGWYAGVDAAPLSPVYGILGMSVELPIARRNQGPLAMTARARETVETRIDLEQRRLERDVLAAWNAYEGRRRELEHLTAAALPAADRTLSFAEAAWQAGRFDVFRVLSAARDAGRVRALRADALEQAWTARVELERAAGGPVR